MECCQSAHEVLWAKQETTIKPIFGHLTHCSIVKRTSDSIAFASLVDPSSPSKGMRRVLLFPGMGHLATTTMAPCPSITWAGIIRDRRQDMTNLLLPQTQT